MWPVQYLLLNGQWYQLSSPWLVFETKHHFFERLRRFGWLEILEITLKYHSHVFVSLGGGFFFPSNSTVHPPPKKSPELLCVMVIGMALYIGTSFHPCRMITIQGSDFPQAAWKFPHDSQREIPPVVGSYSEQHQAALQKRGGVILAGRLGWTSPGVKHQMVDLLVV